MYRPVMTILLFFCVHANAQQHWIKGILLDKNTAAAIANATIRSQADTAVSKKDGQFIIRTTGRGAHLEIIHPGYKTATISPNPNRSFIPLLISPAFTAAGPSDSLSLLQLPPDTCTIDKAIKAYRNETYKKEKENPFIKTSQYPYTAFTFNNGHAAYNNVRRFLFRDKKAPPASVRIGEMLNYFSFDDSIPLQYPERPLQVYADFSICPWNQAHWLMRIAVQSGKKPGQSQKPWNIVLLIDLSGSMSSADKLPLLKIAFKQLILHLRPKDTLAIITYTGKARLTLSPVSGEERLKMLEVIDHLHTGGTTAGSSGIEKAFELAKNHFIPGGNNRVILATDGDFNVGKSTDREMKKLIRQYSDWQIGLTCIGVGSGNYKDSKLATLAQWGQGTFAYIDNKAEALRIFNKAQFQKMVVAARDIRLKAIFNPAQISAFRLLGFDSDGRNAKYAFVKKEHRPGGEIGADQRMTAYVELVPARSSAKEENDPPVTLILQYKNVHKKQDHLQVYQPFRQVASFQKKNADWRFGASVVLFGMLLQNSDYTGRGDYHLVKKIAKEAKEAVPDERYKGYLQLLRQARKNE